MLYKMSRCKKKMVKLKLNPKLNSFKKNPNLNFRKHNNDLNCMEMIGIEQSIYVIQFFIKMKALMHENINLRI